MNKRQYVIFDIDNCLADDSWRIPRINWSTKNPGLRYAGYHDACLGDSAGNIGVFEGWVVGHGCTPIFITARPNCVREKTVNWLRRHLPGLGANEELILIMRNDNDNDHSPSLLLKQMAVTQLAFEEGFTLNQVQVAFDDRDDIVQMYRALGIRAEILKIHDICAYTPPAELVARAQQLTGIQPRPATTAGDVLAAMAVTFKERQSVYKDNYKMVAKLMAVLFPEGVPPELVVQDQFHLFELILVKLSRYAISNLTHRDSVHDLAVYGAMCEAININSGEKA